MEAGSLGEFRELHPAAGAEEEGGQNAAAPRGSMWAFHTTQLLFVWLWWPLWIYALLAFVRVLFAHTNEVALWVALLLLPVRMRGRRDPYATHNYTYRCSTSE